MLDAETRWRRILVGLVLIAVVLWLVLALSQDFVGLAAAVVAITLIGVLIVRYARGGDGGTGRLDQLTYEHRLALEALEARVEAADKRVRVGTEVAVRLRELLSEQLGRLEEFEAGEGAPVALSHLYALDHLATRMLRQAEAGLVLSGAPADPWTDLPIPMSQVLRAAVAEIEEFSRVDVTVDRDLPVLGPAAIDLGHLLAELIENATGFSGPADRVQVRGHAVPDGYIVVVTDAGPGLEPDRAAQIEALLADGASTPDSGALGYQVVARLAARHGVVVDPAPAPGGGVAVTVIVPGALLAGAEDGGDVAPHDVVPFVAAARIAPDAAPVDNLAVTDVGLRRRVPHTNMSPQMPATADPGSAGRTPSPERARSVLAAFRGAVVRGERSPANGVDAHLPPPPTDRPRDEVPAE